MSRSIIAYNSTIEFYITSRSNRKLGEFFPKTTFALTQMCRYPTWTNSLFASQMIVALWDPDLAQNQVGEKCVLQQKRDGNPLNSSMVRNKFWFILVLGSWLFSVLTIFAFLSPLRWYTLPMSITLKFQVVEVGFNTKRERSGLGGSFLVGHCERVRLSFYFLHIGGMKVLVTFVAFTGRVKSHPITFEPPVCRHRD